MTKGIGKQMTYDYNRLLSLSRFWCEKESDMEHVDGKDERTVMLYALSTCAWCKKTRALLEELNVGYDYEYVDLLSGEPEQQALSEVRRYNPTASFPTMVINGEKVVVGFDEEKIRHEFAG